MIFWYSVALKSWLYLVNFSILYFLLWIFLLCKLSSEYGPSSLTMLLMMTCRCQRLKFKSDSDGGVWIVRSCCPKSTSLSFMPLPLYHMCPLWQIMANTHLMPCTWCPLPRNSPSHLLQSALGAHAQNWRCGVYVGLKMETLDGVEEIWPLLKLFVSSSSSTSSWLYFLLFSWACSLAGRWLQDHLSGFNKLRHRLLLLFFNVVF